MNYDLDIVYRAGTEHKTAEALSRISTKMKDDSDIDDDRPVIAVAIRA